MTQYKVITPVWSKSLNAQENENVSITHRAVGAERHAFLYPGGMTLEWFRARFPGAEYIPCRPGWLSSVRSYSQLMLEWRFYQRFEKYMWVVIAQTDAFVTKDLSPLLQQASWDYLGAPWASEQQANWVSLFEPNVIGAVASKFIGYEQLVVGNGGLSARRVAPLVETLRLVGRTSRMWRVNEDVALSFLGARGFFEVASVDVARSSFFERGRAVPGPSDVFGFHALERWHPKEFRKVVEAAQSMGRTN